MWSVNYGLSVNLWKPPKTGRDCFRQVSGIIFINKKNLKNKVSTAESGQLKVTILNWPITLADSTESAIF